MKVGLQIDHRKPFSQLGPTDLENCALLCKRHHDMKTYLGWVLARADDGSWTFTPPDDYRDPDPPDPAVGEHVWSDPWAKPQPEWAEQLALAGAAGHSP